MPLLAPVTSAAVPISFDAQLLLVHLLAANFRLESRT